MFPSENPLGVEISAPSQHARTPETLDSADSDNSDDNENMSSDTATGSKTRYDVLQLPPPSTYSRKEGGRLFCRAGGSCKERHRAFDHQSKLT